MVLDFVPFNWHARLGRGSHIPTNLDIATREKNRAEGSGNGSLEKCSKVNLQSLVEFSTEDTRVHFNTSVSSAETHGRTK